MGVEIPQKRNEPGSEGDEQDPKVSSKLRVAADNLPLSFEMFPPRSAAGHSALAETVDRLADVATGGFSVTMGSGGGTRAGTHETAIEIARRSNRPVMAHLTALGQSRSDVLETAERFWRDGITSVLALRGDPPLSGKHFHDEGFNHANELVAALKRQHDFRIAVAAYPEKHPEAGSLDEDIDFLRKKLDAGASEAICQFVLDPAAYGHFLDACARRGVTAPVVPGLMPLENWSRVRALAEINGTRVPHELDSLFTNLNDRGEDTQSAAMDVFLKDAHRLIAYGAPALHVYALNRWEMPLALARALGHAAR